MALSVFIDGLDLNWVKLKSIGASVPLLSLGRQPASNPVTAIRVQYSKRRCFMSIGRGGMIISYNSLIRRIMAIMRREYCLKLFRPRRKKLQRGFGARA